MPLNKIKYNLAKRKISQAYQQNASKKKAGVEFNPGRSVIILYDCTEREDRNHMLSFQQRLIEQGKSAVLCGYFDGKLSDLNSIPHMVFSKSQTNWLGLPNLKSLEILPEKEYDILFNFDITNHLALSWLSAYIPSKLKTAFTVNELSYIYDLLFDEDVNLGLNKLSKKATQSLLSISFKPSDSVPKNA